MIAIIAHWKRFCSEENGATAIEYGLIASAMGMMLVPAASFLAGSFTGWAAQIVDNFATVWGN